MSQTADLIALMKKFVIEIQQNGNTDLLPEIVADDFKDHSGLKPDTETGPVYLNKLMTYFHSALKDIKVEIIHCVSNGDVVATNKIFRGVQVGEFFGRPATGKSIEMHVMDFIVIKDGKFREHWANIADIVDK